MILKHLLEYLPWCGTQYFARFSLILEYLIIEYFFFTLIHIGLPGTVIHWSQLSLWGPQSVCSLCIQSCIHLFSKCVSASYMTAWELIISHSYSGRKDAITTQCDEVWWGGRGRCPGPRLEWGSCSGKHLCRGMRASLACSGRQEAGAVGKVRGEQARGCCTPRLPLAQGLTSCKTLASKFSAFFKSLGELGQDLLVPFARWGNTANGLLEDVQLIRGGAGSLCSIPHIRAHFLVPPAPALLVQEDLLCLLKETSHSWKAPWIFYFDSTSLIFPGLTVKQISEIWHPAPAVPFFGYGRCGSQGWTEPKATPSFGALMSLRSSLPTARGRNSTQRTEGQQGGLPGGGGYEQAWTDE